MPKSLKDTLNLPKTNFPMRANLAKREPARLARWEEQDVYQAVLEKNADADSFIVPDGPPYANGDIHMGHALNKILKDIVVRYKSMRGYRAPYVPGWDCHGLPIEQQILRQIGSKIHEMPAEELRKMCADYAWKFIGVQRDQFKRLGILGDWEKPYYTMDPWYEVGILETLLELVRKGLIIKGHRTVHWDPVFRTALAEAEIEYHEHESNSIYVRFPLDEPQKYEALREVVQKTDDISIVIWTTTPWTLPANEGVVLHPDLDYVALRSGESVYIVAEGLAEDFARQCKLENLVEEARFKAGEFDRGFCRHPIFPEKSSLIMLGEHVTLEQGTGCVHTAPGHGSDDFLIGQKYGLPVFVPVDDKGCYTSDFPELEGTFVFDANPTIIEMLRQKKLLLWHGKMRHDYPYSWRSKKPIIFRATEQWFFKLEGKVREEALKAIDEDVAWHPSWGKDRIRSMVERRPEWCISRQRSWGVPIPSIRSKASGHSILAPEVIERFIEVVRTKGTDAWFTEPVSVFVPDNFTYAETGETGPDAFEKEYDILDVWFDSGSSHIASMERDPRLRAPADLYLEGSDQHRGWFQAALLTSIGARQRAPFKAVLTHGFVLDGEGRAMSKSMGNVISPLDLIGKYGADIVRLWVGSLDYSDDVAISEEIMGNVARAYRDVRNTLRFQIGNLYDFDYERDAVALDELLPVDRWALDQLADLIDRVTRFCDAYEFHRAYSALTQFCTVALSAIYHDILKDRLYTWKASGHGRRSAQTVIYHMFDALSRMLAPILTFTSDEARAFWRTDSEESPVAVQTERWPEAPADWKSADVRSDFEQLLKVREQVNEKLEGLRQAKEIGKSVDAEVELTGSTSDDTFRTLQRYREHLAELFIVSVVKVVPVQDATKLLIEARHASGERCPRSLRWVPELVETPFGRVSPRDAEALAELTP